MEPNISLNQPSRQHPAAATPTFLPIEYYKPVRLIIDSGLFGNTLTSSPFKCAQAFSLIYNYCKGRTIAFLLGDSVNVHYNVMWIV